MSIHLPYLEILARASRRRFFLPMALAVLLVYALFPMMSRLNDVEEARYSPELMKAVDALKTEVNASPPEINRAGPYEDRFQQRVFIFSKNPFSQIKIPYEVGWVTAASTPYVKSEIGEPRFIFRFDQLALAGSMVIMVVLTLTTLYPASEIAAVNVSQEQLLLPAPEIHSTALQVFTHEVKHAEFRAETLFKRSTYLLTAGVLMAFVGVAVFYATLPEPQSDSVRTVYWISALRSAGMLIFLEAIAWFLLRQYRSLTEDFKSFHRIYMKRANYLAAITVLDKDIVRSEDLLLIAALLGEDFSGKLMSGETTESLENMKNEGVNPVFNLVHDALGKAFVRSASMQGSKSTDKP